MAYFGLREWRDLGPNASYNSQKAGTAGPGQGQGKPMWRLFKALFWLAILGFAGLVGYAYLADYAPERREISAPVPLDVD
jgi:hypothetical protein